MALRLNPASVWAIGVSAVAGPGRAPPSRRISSITNGDPDSGPARSTSASMTSGLSAAEQFRMAHRAQRINRIQADRRRSQRGPRLLDQRLAVVEFTAVAATHRDQRLAPQRFRLCRGTRAAWIIGSARSCRASTILRFGPAGSRMPLRQVDLDEFTGRGGRSAIAGQQWGVQDLREGDIVGVME